MSSGQIYKIHSDFYYVEDDASRYECKIREILKKQKEKISVGDFVEFENNIITSVLPRKNFITRPNVANVDQIVIVSALKKPDLNFLQLNRYIALAEYHNIKPVLCFNKSDLNNDKSMHKKIIQIYSPLNYEIVFTSATENKGLNEFVNLLDKKISVVCGSSGVGKSSLINALNPNLKLRTREVSDKLQRGTHTTRHCEIVKINETSKIIDTPGFSNVKFDFLLPNEVDSLFREIKIYNDKCKYSDCLHINEDGCEVLKNLENIDLTRYSSYLTFVDEAQEYKDRVKSQGKKIEYSKKNINNRQVAKISERKRQSARNTLKQTIYKELDYEEID